MGAEPQCVYNTLVAVAPISRGPGDLCSFTAMESSLEVVVPQAAALWAVVSTGAHFLETTTALRYSG